MRYTINNLGINTDTADMLSDTLPFRSAYERYRLTFPQHVDQLVVVIDGLSPELADSAASRLAQELGNESDIFNEVYLPGAGSFFRHNALLFRSEGELAELSDRLLEIQPFIGRITQDSSVLMLVDTLNKALKEPGNGPELPLDNVFTELEGTIIALQDDRDYRMSWQRLILDTDDARRTTRRYCNRPAAAVRDRGRPRHP